MKKVRTVLRVFIILMISVSLSSCAEESTSYFTETNESIESFMCPLCNGIGCVLCSYRGSVYIPVEIEKTYEKKGSNVSFKRSHEAYYAECSHNCGCKLYVPSAAGNSYCATCANLGHAKSLGSSHIKRYK